MQACLNRGTRWTAAVLAVLAMGLSACSGDKPKPTPLETIAQAKLSPRVLWSVKLDGVRFPLVATLASAGGSSTAQQLALAASDGQVVVLAPDTGREVWRANVGSTISAGVGYDGTRAAVVTRDNQVVVVDNGQERWRKPLPVAATAAPLVAGERVFVMTVDRGVYAYDALNGDLLWTQKRPGEALGLIGSGMLAPFRDALLVGQGPRLAMLDSLRGTVVDEIPIAMPRGTNEVERLADLVGPPARMGDVYCVRSYQSAVGCVNMDRGALVWAKNSSGVGAVAADADLLVAADGADRIQAWRTRNGDTLWSHERLRFRELGGAALLPNAVVFGDAEGQVHFFDRQDGSTLARIGTDSSGVVGAPMVVGKHVVVINRSGLISAISVN